MSDPYLSVVVPCYNEEAVLEELIKRVTSALQDINISSYEIVLVDDGSGDETARLMRAAHTADPRVTGVFLSRNHGHQLALTAGLSVCRGARILIIDADLQDPPELLGPMLEKMDQGFDVVYGKRINRAGESIFKKASAKLFYRFFRKLVDLDMPLDTGDFRLMSRKALNVLLQMPEQHRFIRGMVSWIGFRQAALEYERAERFSGETKYPLKKMLLFAADAITGFSTIPLRLATWLGFLCALSSVPVAIYVLLGFMRGTTVQGWTSVMLIVLILGAIQLIVIGILGEYIGRLYMQSKQRPLFVIDEVLRDEADDTLAPPQTSPTSQVSSLR
ncbi:glycosyltransferase family 2 protein [Roseobacter sp. YSTF-M11]|uniref:Glycosyltransferase family 2 protein n=1 Tax=Roseobacter insulae TaxID=2859783 RepID=A0A9X1K4P1_9RHOB|nr:glycosyltransferase family 2 protein [Roseobacter insulae]MBW4710803.1 glycosyltransferase family 2 protein [Roseobacter insulae]